MMEKLTYKQKKAIIERAKNALINEECCGCCSAVCDALDYLIPQRVLDINDVFPRFKRDIANKHFRGSEKNMFWWRIGNIKSRLVFLDYVLTGKLPKKAKK
jgi:hypothetical protein